ncbi:MAG: DUF6145 family protein [Cellulosilyticaceae bacterium]
MEKKLVICVSPYEHKYFFESEFQDIPQSIQADLIEAVAQIAEKVGGIISVGFYEDGNIYIDQTAQDDVFVDDIGSVLEVKRFQTEQKELLKSLKIWYMIYRTEQGKIVKEIVLLQGKGYNQEQIIEMVVQKHGNEAGDFARALLG